MPKPNTEGFVSRITRKLIMGNFQMEVLRGIVDLGDAAAGVELHNLLGTRLGRIVSLPQIYGTLSRLSDLELVYSESVNTTATKRKGRPRMVYTLTAPGRRMLELATRIDAEETARGRRILEIDTETTAEETAHAAAPTG